MSLDPVIGRGEGQASPASTHPGHVPKQPVSEGFTEVVSPGSGLLRDLSVGRVRLDAKSEQKYLGATGTGETLLHVLVGTCRIEAEGPWGRMTIEDVGEREDVFSGAPTAVVLGPESAYAVHPVTRTVDLAVASVPLDGSPPARPVVIRPRDVPVHRIGEEHHLRFVREVIGGEGPARRLRAGETVNGVGMWSSWPHHKFDANPELAPQFEEVFLYFTKPRIGWALQRRRGLFVNLDPVDDVVMVRNGDAAVLPLGDHPIVSGVDSQVLYVWFYVSPIPKVYAKWAEDVGGYA